MNIRKLNETLEKFLIENIDSNSTFLPDTCLEELKKYNFYNTTTPGQARMKKVFLNHDISKEIESAEEDLRSKYSYSTSLIPNNQGILITQYKIREDNNDTLYYSISQINGYYGKPQNNYNLTNWVGRKTFDELIKFLPEYAKGINNERLQKLEEAKKKQIEKNTEENNVHLKRREKHPDWYDKEGNYLGSPAKRKKDAENEKRRQEYFQQKNKEKQDILNSLNKFGLADFYYNNNIFSLDKEKDAKEVGGVEFSSWKPGGAELWIPATVQSLKKNGHYTQPKNSILRYPIRKETEKDAIIDMFQLINDNDYAETQFKKWFNDFEVRPALSGLVKLEPIIRRLNDQQKEEE